MLKNCPKTTLHPKYAVRQPASANTLTNAPSPYYSPPLRQPYSSPPRNTPTSIPAPDPQSGPRSPWRSPPASRGRRRLPALDAVGGDPPAVRRFFPVHLQPALALGRHVEASHLTGNGQRRRGMTSAPADPGELGIIVIHRILRVAESLLH